MASAVLISIHSKYLEMIRNGIKTVELRRKIWKRNVSQVFVYAPVPIRRLWGWFEVKQIVTAPPSLLWDHYHNQVGIGQIEFNQYFQGATLGHAIFMQNIHEIKEKPRINFWPPQNFRYIDHPEELFHEACH